MEALKAEIPGLRTAAVGGPLMRRAADVFIEDLASRGISGFLEPLFSLGFLRALLARLKAYLLEKKPAALVVVDYYGFNRRVLPLAKAAGVPAYYYVSPQVWASRPGRAAVIARLVRRVFAIFPFEEEVYRRAGAACTFIGHPLLDAVPPAAENKDIGNPLRVALLPGSRAMEVRRHLPVFLDAFDELRRHFPAAEACVFAAASLPDEAYASAAARGAKIIRESDYKVRARMDVAFCSSGTATLENALLGLPMVVIYRLSWPTYWIARALIRVPYIAMANLLAGRLLVPELIQGRANKNGIARAAKEILESPAKHRELRAALASLRGVLGEPGGARRAARAMAEDLRTLGRLDGPALARAAEPRA
ncbi:MAG TPA: lipid-A-disaccharide synthase [Elusimicrobiota bacterium]|nr:lipid-A-disaccharide synthase [Elusimicrobiota bacterium]